ncbi:inositol monophosphatase [Micromonospora sp. R77]|uniref:inositol monophosphatase family protein n=1 Tax=Micromonospora sp. R77 TaxID=2925836 RepID=UPI001F60738A|nr:inositol monophosphatase [Micromonospora sp. R77]MCI4065838.1 inositol monophosphatase [Micromonospora sp. R77]
MTGHPDRHRHLEVGDPGSTASSVAGGAADLRLAFEVSELAAQLALAYFRSGVAATLKDDGTPVTEADRAVERLLRERLSAARPADALLGEEFGRLGTSDRVWIIDPVDGTSFFSRGDPNWRIHVALEVAGRTELAVVTAPALGRRWWAIRGGGSFESPWPRGETAPRRLRVSTTSHLADARVDVLGDAHRDCLPPGVARAPATPLPLVELVRGEIDGFLVERYHLWDHAPWILLVEEAGGRFTDRTGGHAGDQGGGLYSNALLHPHLLTALAYPTHP